jgi:ABC-type transporter Mla maintaining outer membrane lipid asymmetry ATPase subunit MlaF
MIGDPLLELAGADVLDETTGNVVLRDVNWRVARGEFWAIGGAPGSGKSALLATAAGLNRPDSGNLRLFGQNLAEASEETQVSWRRRIGFVFAHGGRLFNHLTVAENVALPVLYHEEGDATARVNTALARAELTAFAQAMPSRLPPRLRQRAAVLRAVIVPAEILFLDEPLTGQSAREVKWWTDFLREQQRAGVTVVATCIDFGPWRGLADRFAVIRGEQLLASEPAGVPELG